MTDRHQSGIFREPSNHHMFLEFGFRDAPTQLRLDGLSALPVTKGSEVVAFGPRLTASLEVLTSPPDMRAFAPIEGVRGFCAPATQQDLFVWLHGARRDELFARALDWREALAPVARIAREEQGFMFRDSRDLTGFVDGSANPKDAARLSAALLDGEFAGGSFVLAQRWLHDLTGFWGLPLAEQERVIGRTKADSVELTGDAMPPDSHVSRTDIARCGEAVKIYRRSSPVGGVRDAGLYFLAFSADLARFEWLLQSMFGLSDDGRRDRLLGYSKPVSGSFFYAPPVDVLLGCFG